MEGANPRDDEPSIHAILDAGMVDSAPARFCKPHGAWAPVIRGVPVPAALPTAALTAATIMAAPIDAEVRGAGLAVRQHLRGVRQLV